MKRYVVNEILSNEDSEPYVDEKMLEEMEFIFDDENLKELDLESLGNIRARISVDIVFVIDITESMQLYIEKVKSLALGLYDDLLIKFNKRNTDIAQMRVRIIAFRDYYCDGKYAMQESEFFYLPDEFAAFKEYVESLEAKGGGDLPENALEALALAMKTDWVQEESCRRHVIMLFTDAPAHPFEKNADNKPELYPSIMFKSYGEMLDAWNAGQGTCENNKAIFEMDRRSKRLILFVPDEELWNEMRQDFENVQSCEMNIDGEMEELQKEIIFRCVDNSCI